MSKPEDNQQHRAARWVNCQHSVELLRDYVDGTLPAEEKAALDRHFRACPPCVEFLRKYRTTPNLCRKALDEEIPKELGDRLLVFLRDKCKQA